MNDALRQSLELAMLRPPDDPQRVAALATARDDPQAQAYLAELSAEQALLTTALRDVPVDPDFLARLSAQPAAAPRSVGRGLRIAISLAVAALLLLTLGLGGYEYHLRRQAARTTALLADISRLAVQWHTQPPGDMLQTSNAASMEREIRGKKLPFMPEMLRLKQPIKLVGAGVSHAAGGDFVYTRWEYQDHFYTAVQFDPAQLAMQPAFANSTRLFGPPGRGYRVKLWSDEENGCGWALVCATNDPFIINQGNDGGW